MFSFPHSPMFKHVCLFLSAATSLIAMDLQIFILIQFGWHQVCVFVPRVCFDYQKCLVSVVNFIFIKRTCSSGLMREEKRRGSKARFLSCFCFLILVCCIKFESIYFPASPFSLCPDFIEDPFNTSFGLRTSFLSLFLFAMFRSSHIRSWSKYIDADTHAHEHKTSRMFNSIRIARKKLHSPHGFDRKQNRCESTSIVRHQSGVCKINESPLLLLLLFLVLNALKRLHCFVFKFFKFFARFIRSLKCLDSSLLSYKLCTSKYTFCVFLIDFLFCDWWMIFL